MGLTLSIVVVVAFGIAVASAWPMLYAVWLRAMPDSRELNLRRLASRRGLTRADMAGEPDLSHAVYRCIACAESSRCDALLKAGRDREIDAFCPNHRYLARAGARHPGT